MVLAEPGRVVTIVDEDVADGACGLWKDRVVTWIACGELRDVAKADTVMIATSKKRRPCG